MLRGQMGRQLSPVGERVRCAAYRVTAPMPSAPTSIGVAMTLRTPSVAACDRQCGHVARRIHRSSWCGAGRGNDLPLTQRFPR